MTYRLTQSNLINDFQQLKYKQSPLFLALFLHVI